MLPFELICEVLHSFDKHDDLRGWVVTTYDPLLIQIPTCPSKFKSCDERMSKGMNEIACYDVIKGVPGLILVLVTLPSYK